MDGYGLIHATSSLLLHVLMLLSRCILFSSLIIVELDQGHEMRETAVEARRCRRELGQLKGHEI